MKRILVIGTVIALAVAVFFLQRFMSRTDVPQVTSLPSDGGLPYRLPEGFEITVSFKELSEPRVIVFDSHGRMLVSESSSGRIVIPGKGVLLENLDHPHGLAFYTDPTSKQVYLYVAEVREVSRYPYNTETGTIQSTQRKNIMNLPEGGRHTTRTIGFGKDFRTQPIVAGLPQGNFLAPIKLYTSIGSSCDVCLEDSWKYAAILESDPEGTYAAEVAGGLRDVEFFTFHPTTGMLWASEQSRADFPDEINIIGPTLKYGWPYCYGGQKRDESFTQKSDRTDLPMDCVQTEPPEIELPSHAAPLGIAFIPENWPAPWAGRLLVAVNDTIRWFDVDETGHVRSSGDFVTGFLVNGKIFGRPVDLKFGPDGALYISDDTAGVIYKISSTS